MLNFKLTEQRSFSLGKIIDLKNDPYILIDTDDSLNFLVLIVEHDTSSFIKDNVLTNDGYRIMLSDGYPGGKSITLNYAWTGKRFDENLELHYDVNHNRVEFFLKEDMKLYVNSLLLEDD